MNKIQKPEYIIPELTYLDDVFTPCLICASPAIDSVELFDGIVDSEEFIS